MNVFLTILSLCLILSNGLSQAHTKDEEPSEFLDMATSFLQQTLASQSSGQGGSAGGDALSGIAQLVGGMMQSDGKGNNGVGAAQIINGLSSLMSNANGGQGGGGIDPALIGNVLEMFAGNDDGDDDEPPRKRRKRSRAKDNGNGNGMETFVNLASMFMNSQASNGGGSGGNDGLMSLLPMVLQAVNSFNGAEGERVHARHRDHENVLPPFLERLHQMWDHFSHSELAEVLWKKSGVNQIFKGYTTRDGKLDYEKLLDALHNQSFRKRWIKVSIIYLADWANYISQPEVYRRYTTTAHLMLNGFLGSQGFPPHTFFDPQRPSETISNLLDYVAREHFHTKVSTVVYVKPAVKYVKDLFKIGQARVLLQKFNATEMSDKLSDAVNLEVIEPVLKVHRAYRFAIKLPQCDKFVLCEVNTHDPTERLELAGLKAGITRFSSMGAAWLLSQDTKTPFWDLFSVINDPYECKKRYPSECLEFNDGEEKIKQTYIHNEL